ncbi:unnamed protein product [Colias eurytheme]|nr:unnamed protein product [Colias eurytheme]
MISGRCCTPACLSEISSPVTTEVITEPRYIYNLDEIKPFNGGVFEVFSYSPIAPTGISVYSENTIQGRLSVAGILPFLGTVEVDGALPTCGRGNVQYSAGNGNVNGITQPIGASITNLGVNNLSNNALLANNIALGNNIAASGIAALGNGITGNAIAANTNAINANANSLSFAGLPISGVSPIGYGDVAVTGEMPVGGSTAVAGNVPVIGFVTFEGNVPAGGTVTLASNCNNPVY